MGVTYKLKSEVVDFIVESKRNTPALSCRKLVDLVRQRFELDVSKSSINAVLKDFDLSSPVGRHPKGLPLKNFFIPKEKKESLLQQVQPFLEQESIDKTSLLVETPSFSEAVVQEEKSQAIAQEVLQEPVAETPLRLAPDILNVIPTEDIAPEDFTLPQKSGNLTSFYSGGIWNISDDLLFEKGGMVFLAAMWWQHARTPAIGQALLRSGIFDAGHFVENEFQQWLEAVFFFQAVFEKKQEELSREEKRTLAALFTQGKADLGFPSIKKEAFSGADRRLAWEIESILAETLAMVSCYELITRSGRKIFMNAFLSGFLNDRQEADVFGLPLFSAIELVADRLVNNIEPLTIRYRVAEDPFSTLFAEYWDLLTGATQDPLDRVLAHMQDGRVFPIFERLAAISRSVLLSGPDQEKALSGIDFGIIADGTVFDCALTQQKASYCKGQAVISGKKVNAFLVKTFEQTKSQIILTNISATVCSDKDIVALLFRTHEQLPVTEAALSRTASQEDCVFVDKEGQLTTIFHNLYEYLQRELMAGVFSESRQKESDEFRNTLYALPAHIINQPGALLVRLIVAPGCLSLEDLSGAAARMNAMDIRDQQGRRLYLSVAPSK